MCTRRQKLSGLAGEEARAGGRAKPVVASLAGEEARAGGRAKPVVASLAGEEVRAGGRAKPAVASLAGEEARTEGRAGQEGEQREVTGQHNERKAEKMTSESDSTHA